MDPRPTWNYILIHTVHYFNRFCSLCLIILILKLTTPCAMLSTMCKPNGYNQQWLEHSENMTVTVVWGLKQAVCQSKHECHGPSVAANTDQIPQLIPVTIQKGTTLQFQRASDFRNTSWSVILVDEIGFTTCTSVNGTIISQPSSVDKIQVPNMRLESASLYFLIEVPENASMNCSSGLRINVTVVDHDCSEAEDALKCNSNGHCVLNNTQNIYTCECCNGYTGRWCQSFENETNSCAQVNCFNGGTCYQHDAVNGDLANNSFGQYWCSCRPHYTGKHCEIFVRPCESNPCMYGICVERNDTFQCYCVPGFHGKTCDQEYNECLSNPCGSGGTCIDRVDRYECRCTERYEGENCEKKKDLCHPNQCQNNATCKQDGLHYQCLCQSGYKGTYCESSVGACQLSPCLNGGLCVDLVVGGFECKCPVSFQGKHCQYMLDVFSPPLESVDMNKIHIHNLYIVAGTLGGAILIAAAVITACYCKMHETYKQIAWKRLHYRTCSSRASDRDIYSIKKGRLNVDSVCKGTSSCYDNSVFDSSSQHQPLDTNII